MRLDDSFKGASMWDLFTNRLSSDDDPALWDAALDYILAEVDKRAGAVVEIGRCSHWLRPNQMRWKADGGFAWPVGYGKRGRGVWGGLPEFDWSVLLVWTGESWELAEQKSGEGMLRVAIPSRTTRHAQAAIHTLWKIGREKQRVFYGFRKKDRGWVCTTG